MKRTAVFCIALLLLVSCGRSGGSLPHSVRCDGCQIGEMIVLNGRSGEPNVYSAAFEKPAMLCRDPLCDHSGTDGLCPDSGFFVFDRVFCTDGEKLYMKVHNLGKRPGPSGFPYEIYAVDPLGTEPMSLVCETENTGNYGAGRTFLTDR